MTFLLDVSIDMFRRDRSVFGDFGGAFTIEVSPKLLGRVAFTLVRRGPPRGLTYTVWIAAHQIHLARLIGHIWIWRHHAHHRRIEVLFSIRRTWTGQTAEFSRAVFTLGLGHWLGGGLMSGSIRRVRRVRLAFLLRSL
jgi:hypothetical protein